MLLIHIICKVTRVYQGNIKYLIVFITWSDFDLENRHLILRTSSSKTKREYTVPINQQVIDSILLVRQKATKKILYCFNISFCVIG
jgi:hypothetical protein